MSDAKQNIQKTYDEFTEALEGIIEPTIKVSELREWCDARKDRILSPKAYRDGVIVVVDEILNKFCGGKDD